MNKVLVLIALFFLWALPSGAQIKPLTVLSTIPTTVTFEGYRSFALPPFCDEKGRSYIKLWESGKGMAGPILRISEKGLVEAEFDTTGTLGNTFAVRPNGGIAGAHLDGKTKVIDNFGPDGKREAEVRLEQPPIPFFPMQIAVFPSGGILLAGSQYRTSDKGSAAVYDSEGHLVKQLVLDGDAEIERTIQAANDKSVPAPREDSTSIGRSVAITGDDGYVYLMRATSSPTVYVISSTGEVIHKIVAQAPTEVGWPSFGIRVIKNRLVVEFHRECTSQIESRICKGTIFSVLDATTGKRLADYELEDAAGNPMACYAPDPDRFFTFQEPADGNGIRLVESVPK
jgi:hypothetical protein